ncbi:ribosomal RNA small subunit methyltransferase E [Lysobacter helvus]|uniref:Ribosomal RNA small subunit methyltransferase E n=2 Tax=Lysobacteraceae TaxID=32033 RepID=A0ABN6FUT7_9GAMM|nr:MULTISPECIES: 16S rRNA (uracil(1498)-N(3))-methyltransferase [Lysobacter]BCT92730.1 ribosomal RNA small subunit methyltransferase E [Lysobacter caseinilyticus]BCT95883.1 ribosomal RNA small subunit methyltransferase E [Lysobacter helvus]
MRTTRVFVDLPLAAGVRVALPDDAANHLVRVLRMQEGDACVLFNGDGREFPATLLAANKRGVEAEVGAPRDVGNESPLRLALVQGIARGEKMDLILQKATELGIAAVHPVQSDRSEVKLDAERAAKRLAHWRCVVVSACEQSGRARVPEVFAAQPLQAALTGLDAQAAKFLLDPEATTSIATIEALRGDVVLAIGPEGGWSDRDRQALHGAGFVGLRLGPRILRTETAGLAAIAAMQARFGDLR